MLTAQGQVYQRFPGWCLLGSLLTLDQCQHHQRAHIFSRASEDREYEHTIQSDIFSIFLYRQLLENWSLGQYLRRGLGASYAYCLLLWGLRGAPQLSSFPSLPSSAEFDSGFGRVVVYWCELFSVKIGFGWEAKRCIHLPRLNISSSGISTCRKAVAMRTLRSHPSLNITRKQTPLSFFFAIRICLREKQIASM